MKTYKLTNATWYRGNGVQHSYLKNETGCVCCLGNALAQEDALVNNKVKTLSEVMRQPTIAHIMELNELDKNDQLPCTSVYQWNDMINRDLTDEARVEKINSLTRPFGFQFEFVPDAPIQHP